jgi:hypothetical protein
MAGREGPYRRDYNTTSYIHPLDENLNNLHKAMEYNEMGEPRIRVNAEGLTLEGNVNLGGPIEIQNDLDNPIPISANLSVNAANNPIYVAANVTGGNVNANVSGTVTVSSITNTANVNILNSPSVTVTSGNINANVSGTITSITNTVNVNILSIPEVEIKNDLNNPIPISKNTSVNSDSNRIFVNATGNINATIDGEVTLAGANPDAFGRARVSETFTLGDYKHLYAIDPNFLDSTANGGSVTFVADQAACVLATSSNTASYAIHQTKFYHHYQPGKSQLIYGSFNFRAPHRNVTKRTGYFDANDGIYFEQVGSDTADGSTVSASTQTLNWVIRTYVGGSPSEADYSTTVNGVPYTYKRRVPQSQWNVDPCDGTGPSGFNLDITKTQLCWIDFQWLGVGRVRVGFAHAGKLITAHEYYHDNILPTVYMSNPNLPVRCEIRNTGTTPGGAFDQICSTVMSEGGYVESGIDWSVATTPRTTSTPGQTRFPLLAIRLKNSFKGYANRLSVRPNSLGLYAETNSILYEVVKFPNAASLSTTAPGGLVWTSADDDSGVEYCVNATSFTAADADRFASGYVPSGSSQNSLSPVATGSLTSAKKNIISQNIDSTNSEVYCVVVSTVNSGNQTQASVAATIQWREIY